MPTKKITSLLLLFFGSVFAFSQTFTVKGKVTDTHDVPLEFSSVSLETPGDHDIIGEDITNDQGEFSIEVPSGEYILYIQTFNGNEHESHLTVAGPLNAGNIRIEEQSVVMLEGATITASSAPIYKMELDKKIYDVSRDDLNKGASLSEALENVPSVQVDEEGNVSLRGNENVRILVDGKPSSLVGISDPANALKSLPADIVDRIEVITNPSARYEAEGSAGIINIVLKKGKLKGLHGSVNLNAGTPSTAGASVNLNHRTGKWNVFTNLSYRHSTRKNRGKGSVTRFGSDGIPRYEEEDQKGKRKYDGFTLMGGTEYYLDDKNTFSLSATYQNGRSKNNTQIHYWDFDSDFNPVSSSLRTQDGRGDNESIEGTFNYKHEFDDDGHELTFDVVSNYSERKDNSKLFELGDFVDSNERSRNSEYQNRTTISVDYVQPFSEKSKLEFGSRAEFQDLRTDFGVDSLAVDNWVPKSNFATRTDYKQNVYAVYAQFGQGFGKFSYFAGLRMENSDIKVSSLLDDTHVKKNYTDLFPSLFLNYEFDSNDQLQLSYSRRIRRPRGWNLIPISSYSNNRNLFLGNPDLNPQYTDSYELSFVTKLGQLMVTPNVYYSHTKDNIQRFQSLDPLTGVLLSKPVNVGTQDRYGGDLTFTYRPWRWWNIMGNLNLFGYRTKGVYSETVTDPESGETFTSVTDFAGKGFSWFSRVSNRFTLPAKFSLQLSGHFRGPSKSAQSKRKSMYGMDLSISKELFNDRASFTIGVRDLLNSRKFRMTSFGENFEQDREFRWNVRSVNFSFSYRFNETQRDQNRKRRPDSNEEFDMEMPQMQ